MLNTLALSALALAFVGGLAFAETTMTREPATGRSIVTPLLLNRTKDELKSAPAYDKKAEMNKM